MDKRPEQAIEEYLDQLSAQLGALPPQIQSETREELRQHLQMLVTMQREPQRVIESALRQFGDPSEIGRRLALEWEEGQWSLSGLSLLQRIDKIRDAGAVEVALVQPNPLLKIATGVQFGVLLLNFYLLLLAQGEMAGPHLSLQTATAARFGLFGLYFVVGLVACSLEARKLTASTPTQARIRTWQNIIGRAGMAVLLPAMFLFPDQSLIVSGAMIALCLVLAGIGYRQPSPRARLAVGGSMGYGMAMGLVMSVVNFWLFFQIGFDNWLWLLLLPVYYALGRWFWKRPPLKMSRRTRLIGLAVGILIVGSAATKAIARRNAKPPSTPMELVESWQYNGAYLAGDTDTAFMLAHMPQALPALRFGLEHRNTHVRMETANTIEGLGTQARPLIPFLKSRFKAEENQSIRVYLAMTFGGIGDSSPKTMAFLRQAFGQESDEEVKTYLAGSLARLTAPRFDTPAWTWLMESLKPTDNVSAAATGWFSSSGSFWDRRWGAAYVLQSMGAAARPALPALRHLGDDSATPTWVKNKVKLAITKIE